MKDPTVEEDPRYVSAYSVYKGLAKLKSYEDSSSDGTAIAKRNKKKAKKRNRKKEIAEANGKPEKVESSTDAGTSSDKKGPSTSSAVNGGEASLSKRQRQRKRNKKKAAQLVSTSAETSVNDTSAFSSALESSVNPSDDEDEPPVKSRKTNDSNNIVPNPLAFKGKSAQKANGLPTPGSKKADKQKSKPAPVPVSVDKGVGSKKSVSSKQVNSIEKPSTSKQAISQNGSSKKHTETPKQKKNVNAVAVLSSSSSKSSPFTVTSKVPPLDIKSVFTSTRIEDSVSHAKTVLDWLLHPVSSDEFMKTYWEKKPLLVKRKHDDSKDYYKWILTTQSFDDMLRRHPIKYGVNLDITSYVDGKRETLSENMQGRVRPAVVWDYYNNGCSLRMLNPQTYIQPLWKLNSSLQEWFGSFVGANMYLTPPDSQGFAPHYDDIDAFILQIEGKKRWKLYAARNEEEVLPRFSSRNFSEETDNLGEPILDVVLEEGDLLYFPRGVIHQAQTVDGEHSLHITLSSNQLNTYGDLLKHHVNHALDKLMAKDVSFRKGLPVDYLSFMGIAHENTTDKELKKKRNAFSNTIEELVSKLAKEPADFAADAMGKKFIWDSLPPHLNSKERETTVVEDGEFMQNGKVFNRVEFGPETKVKFVRKHCVRLVVEEEQIRLYFSSENPLIYHDEEEPQYLEISVELAPAINHLISQYPKYTKIEDLPISSNDFTQTIQLVSDLWERGLLFTKDPLEPCIFDDFESGESDQENNEDTGETSGLNSGEDEGDVESINLSDLPEEGAEDTTFDDFYDTSMMIDSDEDEEDEDDDGQLFLNTDDEENTEDEEDSNGEEGDYYDIDEDSEFDEDEEDEEEEGEEEEDDDDEIDFDVLDGMEETDSE